MFIILISITLVLISFLIITNKNKSIDTDHWDVGDRIIVRDFPYNFTATLRRCYDSHVLAEKHGVDLIIFHNEIMENISVKEREYATSGNN